MSNFFNNTNLCSPPCEEQTAHRAGLIMNQSSMSLGSAPGFPPPGPLPPTQQLVFPNGPFNNEPAALPLPFQGFQISVIGSGRPVIMPPCGPIPVPGIFRPQTPALFEDFRFNTAHHQQTNVNKSNYGFQHQPFPAFPNYPAQSAQSSQNIFRILPSDQANKHPIREFNGFGSYSNESSVSRLRLTDEPSTSLSESSRHSQSYLRISKESLLDHDKSKKYLNERPDQTRKSNESSKYLEDLKKFVRNYGPNSDQTNKFFSERSLSQSRHQDEYSKESLRHSKEFFSYGNEPDKYTNERSGHSGQPRRRHEYSKYSLRHSKETFSHGDEPDKYFNEGSGQSRDSRHRNEYSMESLRYPKEPLSYDEESGRYSNEPLGSSSHSKHRDESSRYSLRCSKERSPHGEEPGKYSNERSGHLSHSRHRDEYLKSSSKEHSSRREEMDSRLRETLSRYLKGDSKDTSGHSKEPSLNNYGQDKHSLESSRHINESASGPSKYGDDPHKYSHERSSSSSHSRLRDELFKLLVEDWDNASKYAKEHEEEQNKHSNERPKHLSDSRIRNGPPECYSDDDNEPRLHFDKYLGLKDKSSTHSKESSKYRDESLARDSSINLELVKYLEDSLKQWEEPSKYSDSWWKTGPQGESPEYTMNSRFLDEFLKFHTLDENNENNKQKEVLFKNNAFKSIHERHTYESENRAATSEFLYSKKVDPTPLFGSPFTNSVPGLWETTKPIERCPSSSSYMSVDETSSLNQNPLEPPIKSSFGSTNGNPFGQPFSDNAMVVDSFHTLSPFGHNMLNPVVQPEPMDSSSEYNLLVSKKNSTTQTIPFPESPDAPKMHGIPCLVSPPDIPKNVKISIDADDDEIDDFEINPLTYARRRLPTPYVNPQKEILEYLRKYRHGITPSAVSRFEVNTDQRPMVPPKYAKDVAKIAEKIAKELKMTKSSSSIEEPAKRSKESNETVIYTDKEEVQTLSSVIDIKVDLDDNQNVKSANLTIAKQLQTKTNTTTKTSTKIEKPDNVLTTVACDKQGSITELKEMSQDSSPGPLLPNRHGAILNRVEYYTYPDISTFEDYMNERGECLIPGLTIGRKGYGSVYFPDVINVRGMNFDQIVFFRHKEVVIYPDGNNKPPVGQGLNRPARITLEGVYPRIYGTWNQFETNPDRIRQTNFRERLIKVSRRHGRYFIDYNPNGGIWIFDVPNF